MTFRQNLSELWSNIQDKFHPDLNKNLGQLSSQYKNLVAILKLIRIEEFLPCYRFNLGRPPKDRIFIARSFVAKIFLKIPYTKSLVQQLKADKQLKIICGWDLKSEIPSESKFSRVFEEFTKLSLSDKVHQSLISEVYKNTIIGHVIKDSTPITAREKFLKKKALQKSEREYKINSI